MEAAVFEKFSKEQIREICSTGTETKHLFFIPFEVGEHTITFKISYWHDRAAYVAEPGIMSGEVWSPREIVAPQHLIDDFRHHLTTECGIPYLAGITELDHVDLRTTILKVRRVSPTP